MDDTINIINAENAEGAAAVPTIFYNRWFIKVHEDGTVAEAWSNGPFPDKDTADAICINHCGGYQLRLAAGGEENPPLYTLDGIPLYRWDGAQVVSRTEEEIAADRAAIPAPPPSEMERLRADVDFLAAIGGVEL